MKHVNLIRPCVGIDSPRMLFDRQIAGDMQKDANGNDVAYFTTRNTPKRSEELLNGGSIYWIIKGKISMRQKIVNIETHLDETNRKYCIIYKSPEIIITAPHPHRAMQGWRYLEAEKAPKDLHVFDLDNFGDNDIDPQMAAALSELGLL